MSDTTRLISLLSNPFQSQIASASVAASTILSLSALGFGFVAFTIFRPRKPDVYGPTTDARTEQLLNCGVFSWLKLTITPVNSALAERLGLDGAVLILFLRMCRNIFGALSIIGCAAFVPTLLTTEIDVVDYQNLTVLTKLTPIYMRGERYWVFVMSTYLFNATLATFLWMSSSTVAQLRAQKLASPHHQISAYRRFVLVFPISAATLSKMAADKFVTRSCNVVESTNRRQLVMTFREPGMVIRATKGRHVLWNIRSCVMEKSTVTSSEFESHGFARFYTADDAKIAARSIERCETGGVLAHCIDDPCHIISDKDHTTARITSGLATFVMIALTIAFVVPNIFTAIFLSNVNNLALLWKGLNHSLKTHSYGWAIVQGILAPILQSLFYMLLPFIFGKLDATTSRGNRISTEMRVLSNLYTFLIFNKLLVFSMFSTVWAVTAASIASRSAAVGRDTFSDLIGSLCITSTYWLCWQMQRILDATLDMIRLWPLVRAFATEMLYKGSADMTKRSFQRPQPCAYADYYSNYLLSVTVGLCFAPIQPLILPVTAVYFSVEACFKSYSLQCVLVTEAESDGQFWRAVSDRMLFAMILADFLSMVVVGAQGSLENTVPVYKILAMAPLPCIAIGLKLYWARQSNPICSWRGADDPPLTLHTAPCAP